jgi:predicted phage terminase large subunit-like protein
MAPKVGGRPIDVIVIEGKANGKSLRQSLAKDGIATVQFNPTKDKLERGHFVSPIAKDGIIWVPGKEDKDGKRRFLSWAEPLVEQLCSYSGEGSLVHEDLYDTATQAWSTIDWYWLHHAEREGQKGQQGACWYNKRRSPARPGGAQQPIRELTMTIRVTIKNDEGHATHTEVKVWEEALLEQPATDEHEGYGEWLATANVIKLKVGETFEGYVHKGRRYVVSEAI